MEDLILALIQKYPQAASILLIIGILRAINKPLFSLLMAYVEATPSKADNELLQKIISSKGYKWLSYVLDWGASIKLPQKPEQK